jgi:glycosyltransferase involved in cell wall biosynthesis
MNTPKKLFIIWHGALFPSYRKPFWILREQYGWEVHLLAASRWSKALPRLTRFQKAEDEPIHLHVHHPVLSFHGAFHVQPVFPWHFYRIQPDAVLVIEEPYSLMGWWVTYWCRRCVPPIPVIVFSYQDILKNYPPPFAWFEQYVLKHADRLLVSNTQGGGVIINKGYSRLWDVLPTAVNLDRFSYKEPRDRGNLFTLGYVGRLANEKGLDTLFWSLTDLTDDVRLRIVGDGPARERLHVLMRELGLQHQIAFLPAISHEELPEFYHDLDALVLPSKTTKNWQEQFGRVLTEAMACGVPVIGSSSGAIPEVIGDAGFDLPRGQCPATGG